MEGINIMFIEYQLNVNDCSDSFMQNCIDMAEKYTAPFQAIQKEKYLDIMESYFSF